MNPVRLLLHRHRNALFILIASFLIPVFTNLISSLLEKIFGQTPAQLVQLAAIFITLIFAVFALTLVGRITPVRWELVPREMKPQPKAGLIALTGPGRANEEKNIEDDVTYIAIRYHLDAGRLKYVWLLASNEGMKNANQLRELFNARVTVEIVPIQNILTINETYAAVRAVYTRKADQMGIPTEDLIADYTGGTKPMSAGMILACANLLPMQFISGRAGAKSTPIQTDFLPPAPQDEKAPPPC